LLIKATRKKRYSQQGLKGYKKISGSDYISVSVWIIVRILFIVTLSAVPGNAKKRSSKIIEESEKI